MVKLVDEIREYLGEVKGLGKYVLDVGTGSANMALALAEDNIRCISIEKSQKAYLIAKDKIAISKVAYKPLLLKVDARKMPFLNETFSCVVAYKSMHHIESAEIALDEMIRVCKEGGNIVIIEHHKDVRSAIDFMSERNGTKHPSCIDINTIYNYLKKKRGIVSLINTSVGVLCIFKKSGNLKQYNLEEKKTNIEIGELNNNLFLYDSFKNILKVKNINNNLATNIIYAKNDYNKVTSSLCLNLANRCNMKCKYCYADGGSYGQIEKDMSEEIALAGIEFMRKRRIINHIILFGGEPLLNSAAIKDIIKKYGKEFTYSINTNATLLTEDILKLFKEYNVKVSISIDGSRETHDSQRVFNNSLPTYDVIQRNIDKIPHDLLKDIWARVTVTNRTSSIYDDIVSIIKMGFTKIDMSFVSGNKDFSEDESVLKLWQKDIKRLVPFSLNEWLNGNIIIYPFVKIYQSILFGKKAQDTCTAGREMYSLQPNGEIVPCFKFSNYPIGYIDDDIKSSMVAEFEQYKQQVRNIVCDNCWVYDLCGGLCPKDFVTIINIQQLRCRLIQYIVKTSLLYLGDLYFREPFKFDKVKYSYSAINWIRTIKEKNYDKRERFESTF